MTLVVPVVLAVLHILDLLLVRLRPRVLVDLVDLDRLILVVLVVPVALAGL